MRAPGSIVGFLALRLSFVAFCLVTSLYCLIAFIPFTYQQVIEFQVVGWTLVFARYHPAFYWAAFACAAWTLRDDYRPGTRVLTAGVLGAGVVAGAVLTARPLLATLGNEAAALTWAGVWLLPPGLVALVDLAGAGRRITWAPAAHGEYRHLLRVCVVTGAALALVYAAIQPVRPRGVTLNAMTPLIVGWSVTLHVVVCLAIFGVLATVHAVASRWRHPAAVEFGIVVAIGCASIASIIGRLIFASISLVDTTGLVLAGWLGVTIGLTLAGCAVRLAPPDEAVTSGLGLALRPVAALAGVSRPALAASAIAWAALAYGLAAVTSVMDWNYLFQTVGVIVIWMLGLAWAYAGFDRGRPVRPVGVAAVWGLPVAAVVVFAAVELVPGWAAAPWASAGALSAATERYAAYDVSFRMVRGLLGIGRPTPRPGMDDFYALLRRHTNIPRTVTIVAPDVALGPSAPVPSGRRPHIFFFTIDSLRPDYLSPYNAAVAFTPEIERFAADSTVFRNAFTRYGATGLSEPALWTGSAVPHQQYPEQYWRMNALQQLLQGEHYQAFVSKDHILQRLLAPWPDLTELDRGRNASDYDACRTLAELGDDLARRDRSDPRLLFAFTQPQNVHIAAITREGGTVPPGERYPGFFEPYASRVRRLDACFGGFLDVLRREHLYDDSLIILTSDHGESLGEGGRWGHAYTLFPEVLKIPMIVHLPEWLRGASADPNQIAFSIDLTPSLYYLCGRRPLAVNPLFGRPLFTDRPDEATPYLRERYVVTSSYGPVYAVISDRGRSLYIADGVSNREFAFDMTAGPGGAPRDMADAERDASVRAIRDMIGDLARFARLPLDVR